MTTLVGIETEDGVLLGADSASTTNGRVILRAGGKLIEYNRRLAIATAGSARGRQVLQHHVEPPRIERSCNAEQWVVEQLIPAIKTGYEEAGWLQTKDGRDEQQDCWYLIAVDGALFGMWQDFQLERSLYGHHAMGSGCSYALGSLFTTSREGLEPRARAQFALEAAACFDVATQAPFDFVTVRRP